MKLKRNKERVLRFKPAAFLQPLQIIFFIFAFELYSESRRVVIFQTADTHAVLKGDFADGIHGWFFLTPVISGIRLREGGRKNTLLIDCGDTMQGSFEAALSKGAVVSDILNCLEYDAWIPGNHDFDFGHERFAEISRKIKADILAANVPEVCGVSLSPWKIYERNGARIAVIGMSSPNLGEWHWGNAAENISTESVEKSFEKILPAIMDSNPDMMILAVHADLFSKLDDEGLTLLKFAEKYPQIDLILGAHTHQDVPGGRIGGSGWFVQTGKHCRCAAAVEAVINIDEHCVERISSCLMPSGTMKDENFSKIFKTFLSESEKVAPLPVAVLKSPHKTGTLIRQALMKTMGAKIAFYEDDRDFELSGTITEMDLFRAVPYEDTVCSILIDGSEFRQLVKAAVKEHGISGNFPFCGISTKFESDGTINGKIVFSCGTVWEDENRKIKIALSSYALAGAGGRLPVLKKISKNPGICPSDAGISVKESLRNYLSDL